jgi:hypothetical protein
MRTQFEAIMSTVAEKPPASDAIYIDTAEVARLLNLAPSAVRWAELTGRIPRGIRFSRKRVRWPLSVIQELARSGW